MVRSGEKIAPSIVDTGSSTISRVHETRVEMDAEAVDADFDIIRGDDRITDVVIVSANGCRRLPVPDPPNRSQTRRDSPRQCSAAAQPEVQL